MSTPLIVISSRTGNTLRVGEAISEALPGSVVATPQTLPEDLSDFNPVLLGFWCDRWDVPEEMVDVALRLKNKKIGCFATLGSDPNDPKSQDWIRKASERLVRIGKDNELVQTFLCQGRISPEVMETLTMMMGGKLSDRALANHEKAKAHPDKNDLTEAADIFRSAFGMNW